MSAEIACVKHAYTVSFNFECIGIKGRMICRDRHNLEWTY